MLKDLLIYYFRTEKESIDGQPLGAIPVQNSRMDEYPGETKGTRMIAIHTRHRTYKLQAESVVMAEWIEKIHEAMRVKRKTQRNFF